MHGSTLMCSTLLNPRLSVTHTHVNLDFKGKQGKEPESPLFYFHRKKAVKVGLEPTTSRSWPG